MAKKPFVSIVVPGFNEEEIVVDSLSRLCEHLKTLEERYEWELIFVNDGSTDRTEELARSFAAGRKNVKVLSHFTNFQLGQALRFAFSHCDGDIIVTIDVDLSYSPDHIESLVETMLRTHAKIVLASPYMLGGTVSNVPFLRRLLSRWANRFLSLVAKGNISTLTSMVRAYDREFITGLNLKAMDTEINPEIIYKAQLLRARIVEIPGHLSWSPRKAGTPGRRSSMRLVRAIASALMSGFIFRPFMFFIVPGLGLLTLALYTITWIGVNVGRVYSTVVVTGTYWDDRFAAAVGSVFRDRPHAFFVGGISLIVALQLISLGFIATQNKRYFEEIFHLGSRIMKLLLIRGNTRRHDAGGAPDKDASE